jgi:hypothetical protein
MHTTRSPERSRFGKASGEVRRATERFVWLAPLAALSALLLSVSATHAIDPIRRAVAPRVLIVGGGPNLQNNQVAIESNVRYVGKLLPQDTARITLFADGDANNATVLYDESPSLPAGERLFNLIMRASDAPEGGSGRYRKPKLGAKLDGASRKTEIQKAFTQLAADNGDPTRPVMLYFTGHGSRNGTDLENNLYDLWGAREGITVRELSREIARLPEDTPVSIVMVQCFSGAFGNLVFENGDPLGEPLKRDIAGFFATVKERVAAGCTSAVNEADYHDFTSYFFAALTGHDRIGKRVSGADYNGDGRVGMDEAYCYTLIHDDSIDVPVCTSDVFLRRFVPLKESDVFQTPYSSVLAWASPAQRAALEALSTTLNRSDEDRLSVSYERMKTEMGGTPEWKNSFHDATQKFESLRREGRRTLISRWPELRRPGTDEYRQARKEAIAQLAREAEAERWKDLLDANDAVDKADQEGEAKEIAASRNLRFVRLGKSVIIGHWLKEHGSPELKVRFARLVAAEARTPLPPNDQITRRDARDQAIRNNGALTLLSIPNRANSCCTWDRSPLLRDPSGD